MALSRSTHIKRIQRRVDFLSERIEQSDEPNPYDTSEFRALRWALEQIDNDERNITTRRAYTNGQINLLKFYKKVLGRAIRSNNTSTLSFLFDRTNEWLEEAEARKRAGSAHDFSDRDSPDLSS